MGRMQRRAETQPAAVVEWLHRGSGIAAAAAQSALFDPPSRASVLNFPPAANQWCTYGATAAVTRVAPRLKKPLA
jgi:hypothetical protein